MFSFNKRDTPGAFISFCFVVVGETRISPQITRSGEPRMVAFDKQPQITHLDGARLIICRRGNQYVGSKIDYISYRRSEFRSLRVEKQFANKSKCSSQIGGLNFQAKSSDFKLYTTILKQSRVKSLNLSERWPSTKSSSSNV